jgi:hypothetical protein
MTIKIEKENQDPEVLQKERTNLLEKMFKRHLSKCIGRGALTLGTQETIPTETLQIPTIS